nr:immunoglobulin light chain junction region [Macaca mulatta]MOX48187.1 immunoglobulin light chain junction region [Macaca mulatta]MOX48562.1 immunoglobulin light chain junction region [Macaca mulatta]MOX49229.1 immunoglobulin light chain junction region [Macaca mulatta]MOX49327.1 immunoglobulin light chain junction region [Macaca mulatta]
CQQGKSTPLTF